MCRGPARVVSIQARPTSVPSFSVSSNLAVSVACHSSRMSKLWEITSYSKDIKDIQISRPFQNEYRKLMEDFHATSFKFSQTWTLLRKTLETTRSRKKILMKARIVKNLNTISEDSLRVKSPCELMPPLGSTSHCHLVQRSHSPPWAKACVRLTTIRTKSTKKFITHFWRSEKKCSLLDELPHVSHCLCHCLGIFLACFSLGSREVS